MKDEPRIGHSSDVNQDGFREFVECNRCRSAQELTVDFRTSQSTMCHHLKKTGKGSKLGIWVPHTISEKNKEDCISRVTSLLSWWKNDPFLKNTITGNKK